MGEQDAQQIYKQKTILVTNLKLVFSQIIISLRGVHILVNWIKCH